MIKNLVKAGCLVVLIMGFVSLAHANSTQSIPLAQEFDDSAKPQTKGTSTQQIPDKQQVIATAAQPDRTQNPKLSTTDQTQQAGQGGLREMLSTLLPSKQDLDKAFNDMSSSVGPQRPTNWRENGQ
jgi:hypothetical protein